MMLVSPDTISVLPAASITRVRWAARVIAGTLLVACSADSSSPGAGSGNNDGVSPSTVSPVAGASGSGVVAPGAAGYDSAQVATRSGAGASCAALSMRAVNQRRPADIIFAVDNSGSMSDEIAFVRERLNGFSQQIVDSGVDVRIILISSPLAAPRASDDDDDDEDRAQNGICIAAPLGSGVCPTDSRAPAYLHIPREVESHDALNLFVSTFPQWQVRLRPNASKTFVVVTDDNADEPPNNSAAAFEQSIATLPGGFFGAWSFSGIYCASQCRDAAAIGTVYDQLVKQRNGVNGDLCQQNFAPVFDALAAAVVQASGLECTWDIPALPSGQALDRERVNVEHTTSAAGPTRLLQVTSQTTCGNRAGWYYDDPINPTRVLACPATCAALQNDPRAQVDILFGCETQVAPD